MGEALFFKFPNGGFGETTNRTVDVDTAGLYAAMVAAAIAMNTADADLLSKSFVLFHESILAISLQDVNRRI